MYLRKLSLVALAAAGLVDAAGKPCLANDVPSRPVQWDAAFSERTGNTPVHFTARYVEGNGQVHRLEEWRTGSLHLRRKTDERIDLHADAVPSGDGQAQPVSYVWQIIDLQKRIDHRVSTAGMVHLGMLYSYYSMAHVLARPAGTFAIEASEDPAKNAGGTVPGGLTGMPVHGLAEPCAWWQIEPSARPATRVCWLERYGVPARLYTRTPSGWQLNFQLEAVDTHTIPPTVFAVSTTGLQVRDLDELQTED